VVLCVARKQNPNQKKQLLELLEEGNCGKEISKILNISQAAVSKRISALEKANLISSDGGSPKFYKLTQLGKINLKSLRVRPSVSQKKDTPNFRSNKQINSEDNIKKTTQTSYILDKIMVIHDYKIKFKILQHGQIPAGGISKKVKGWTKHFYDFNKPRKIRIEITTDSMIIYATDLKLSMNQPYENFMVIVHAQILAKITEFSKKNGYILDYQNPKVISQHNATKVSPTIDKKIPKHIQHTLRLGRPAESMTGQMNQEAQVWGDKSRGLWELETNDMHYAKLMQEVPLRIKNIDENVIELKSAMKELGEFNQAIELYTKQINLHLSAINGIKEGVQTMNQNQIQFNNLLNRFTSILEKLEKKL